MSNQLIALLSDWYPLRDDCDWVLGTVFQTEGPAYRKAGAMMLFGGQGQQLGMLSGGCLESDILRHARRVMQTGGALTLTYDGSDEDDVSFQLGIGCGGTVHIVLQPVNAANHYLMLDSMYLALKAQRSGYYYQLIPGAEGQGVGEAVGRFVTEEASRNFQRHRPAKLQDEGGQRWLQTPVSPPPHLLIVGGGIDARPVAGLGYQLGWRVSVWDPRPANGRREYFPTVHTLLSGGASDLAAFAQEEGVDAAVLMSHNIQLDADGLKALQPCRLGYLAMLGPKQRRDRVVVAAGIDESELSRPLAGPAGLDIGAELPESIALAILSECHAALTESSARSFSEVLPR